MTLTTNSRVFLIVAVLAALVFLPAYLPVEAQRQQDNRALRMQEVKELPARAKRFALVIGVDEYRDKQINRLWGAAKDAQTLKDALVRYAGFPEDQVTLLATGEPEEREPSRANILQRLLNLTGLVPQDGLLLVSFAGHGMQRGERGFLLPVDAKIGSLAQLENTAISVADMKRFIRQTGVRQVLVIMDACRNDPDGRADGPNQMSGAYRFDFDTRNEEVEAFATLYATDVGNRAYEYTEKNQGYFTWFLVEGLKGEAANARGEVTLSGLVQYLQEKVPKRVLLDLGQEKKQRPWADVQGYKAEELVISMTVRVPPVTPTVSALDPAALEMELWSSVKISTDPDDFKVYLEKYPNGTFAGVARNRIRQLEAAVKAVSPTTNPIATDSAKTQPVPSGAKPAAAIEMNEADLKRFAGKYQLKTPPIEVNVEIVDRKLKAVIPGQPIYTLVPIAASRFRIEGAPEGFFMQFELAGNRAKGLTIEQGTGPKLTLSLKTSNPSAELLGTSAGTITPIDGSNSKSSPTAGAGGLPLRGFEFDVVTVNSRGSETSRRKGQAQYFIGNIGGLTMEMVAVQGGTFTMGSTEYASEKPPHQVTVASFYIGKYEVIQSQWRAVAGLPKIARHLNPDPAKFKGDNLPVEQVSWDDAGEFCARLSRATGRAYRLPTEAEWEYACRAGTTTPFAFGETVTPQLVNYDGNQPYAQAPMGTYRDTTTPVGFMGVGNAFGLFDMHGNVWEWCMDYWHETYNGAPTDGRAWEMAGETRYRVLRGGSWVDDGRLCRSAARHGASPDLRTDGLGFRVVVGARTP